jgi:hypothetical protein
VLFSLGKEPCLKRDVQEIIETDTGIFICTFRKYINLHTVNGFVKALVVPKCQLAGFLIQDADNLRSSPVLANKYSGEYSVQQKDRSCMMIKQE